MNFKELSAHGGFAQNDLDRQSAQRENDDYIATLENHPQSRSFAIVGEKILTERTADGDIFLFPRSKFSHLGAIREKVFLGHDGSNGVFAVSFDEKSEILAPILENLTPPSALSIVGDCKMELLTIALQKLAPPKILGRLAEAKALLHWHARHRFCGKCGANTFLAASGWKRVCPACREEHFPRTDPVTIMLAVRGDQCLLGRQPKFPPNMYSALAGFIEPGETIENAARREILEETGITCGAVTYLASQPWPFPCSLMIGCVAQALNSNILLDETELEDARWFSRSEILTMLAGEREKFCPPKLAIAHSLISAWAQDLI